MEEIIKIPNINLNWSEWYKWNDLKLDARVNTYNRIHVPNKQSGVYEAKYEDVSERLTIGRASNLCSRIKQGLVKGNIPHSAGERMRSDIDDFSKVVVRWAITDRPPMIEKELHKKHRQKYGKLPKYVLRT